MEYKTDTVNYIATHTLTKLHVATMSAAAAQGAYTMEATHNCAAVRVSTPVWILLAGTKLSVIDVFSLI